MFRAPSGLLILSLAGVLAGCAGPGSRAGDESAGAGAPSETTAARREIAAAAEYAAPLVVPAGSRRVTLEVGGMVCDACIELVGRELKAVGGVSGVSGSFAKQSFEVACDSGVADTALTAAVRRAGPQYLGMIVER